MTHTNSFKWCYFIVLICILAVSSRKGHGRGDKKNFRKNNRYRDVDDINDLNAESATFLSDRTATNNIVQKSLYHTAEEAMPIQQRLLNVAKTKFNSINNGHYQYEIQKTCSNCHICDIQSMKVIVTDDTASDAAFAEGNDYALTHFCLDDDNAFKQRIIESKLSIDDLFTVIEESITNEVDIGVTYHEDIGIPLSVSINPNTDAVNTQFIAINCIEFDALYPSPEADTLTDIIKASKTVTNTRNRDSDSTRQSINVEDFNADDPYACGNILVPSRCSDNGDYFKCFRYSDGCNTCSCDEDGMVIGCTQRVCDTDIETQRGECIECEANTEWVICGDDNECIADCDSVDNLCGNEASLDCSAPRCECPSLSPRWNGVECITESECGIGVILSDNHAVTSIETDNGVCIAHCAKYSDGCLSCDCDDDGEIVGLCTLKYDEDCSFKDRECIECEDVERMYYTECGTRDITCGDVDTFMEITGCVSKCQCKEEFPIYDAINGKCIAANECIHDIHNINNYGRCIEHCPIYYDGCNACQCPHIDGDGDSSDEGADFCSNLRECLPQVGGSRRMCFRCQVAEMEYVQCGSCDRTCSDPNPSCLESDECIEKCECPLYAPIYDDGECITAEECVNSIDVFDVFDVNNHELRQNAKTADEYAFKALNGDHEDIVERRHYEWQDIVIYVIIVLICAVAGLSLLFWPCLYIKNATTNSKQSNIKQNIAIQSIFPLPDGTIKNKNNAQLP